MADRDRPNTDDAGSRRLSRRQFIPGAAGVVAVGAAGVVGYELRGSKAAAEPTETHTVTTQAAAPVETAPGIAGGERLLTRPDLRPPVVAVTDFAPSAAIAGQPRFIALAPISTLPGGKDQHGPMLVDRRGRVVWFQPEPGSTFDLKVQRYDGKPVLTWWQGDVIGAHGAGITKIVDGSYRTLATVGSSRSPIDLHDFYLTSRGTALVTRYTSANADLSLIGGAARAQVWVGHALEVDVRSGRVLLDWSSLDHVGIAETYKPLPPKDDHSPYDYFHLNSLSELPDGHLLVCARNTWAVYKVDRRTGRVLWRLGGKRSDFRIAKAATFSWQHHVRTPAPGTMTVFDNGANTGDRSRALVLDFNESGRSVSLRRALLHPAAFLARTLGSVQLFGSGATFVGWGSQPYMSSFDAEGTMLDDGQLPIGIRSYRTFAVDWVGRPPGSPAIVARANPAGGFAVYASWNGATEIDRWVVLAGKHRSSLQQVGWQSWSGLETAIVVNSEGPYFQVVALDASGDELGRSEVV